jgi:hypothetical protein
MNLQLVTEILKSKHNNLMKLVPTSAKLTSRDYNEVFETNYPWYQVVIGLSGKCTDSKKRAAKMGFDYNLDLRYMTDLWIKQKGRCQLTGQIMSFQPGNQWNKNPLSCSIDRIDNSQGYIKGNVRLLTHWANNAKSTWDFNVFESMIKSSSINLGLINDTSRT